MTSSRGMALPLRRVIPLVLLLAPACSQVEPVGGNAVLFEGARLIPGTGAPPIEDGALLVEAGRITRLGRRGEVPAPEDALRVELSGRTVIPALIGAHGHPGHQEGLTFSSGVYSRESLLRDLDRAAYFGVGTVLSMGIDPGELAFEIREETSRGQHGGARLLTAGRGIGAPNAGPGFATWAGIAYEVTTEDEGRTAVRELAQREVDQVKIWVDDRGGRAPSLAPSVSQAILEEARALGIPVTAHVFYHEDAEFLAEAGVSAFAHMARDREMSESLVATIVRNGIYVMPNLGGSQRSTQATPPWEGDPHLLRLVEETVAPEVVARIRETYAARTPEAMAAARERYGILERSVQGLAAAGARIVVGPDTGLSDHFFGYAEQLELEWMVAAGMEPMEALTAATSQGAAYLGLSDTGALEEGRRADFVVLDADPLDDIRNTRRIVAVYLAGRETDREAIRLRLGR